jgi:hypothetical protein
MAKTILTLLLCFVALFINAQYGLLQLNGVETQWYQNGLLQDTNRIHHAIRPYQRSEVEAYSRRTPLLQDSIRAKGKFWNWVGRKLWQEDFLRFTGENYTLTVNPVVVFSGGQDTEAEEYGYTYWNTRGARVELALGEKVSAYSTIVETQAQLPWHVTRYMRTNGRVAPGYWKAKGFGATAFDFGLAAGEVAFTPNKTFHFRLGHGKQFIGNGYRSMFISDNTVNYPFFRIETQFGRVKYINSWAIMNDIRPSVMVGDIFAKKYLSMHYLSIGITPRLYLGLFEGNMWGDELNRYGFDVNFLNPVIFFRPVEFAQGPNGGNTLIGMNLSYQFEGGIRAYGQVAMDDFKLSSFRNWSEGDWINLYAWQLGLKYGDAFGIRNLFLRAEYNAARPYMYSHREVLTNWAHYGQALAHPWGGNFEEVLFHLNYRKDRWLLDAGIHLGTLGRDTEDQNFGGDIFQPHETRVSDLGNFIGNGEASDLTYWRAELSYIFNPIYNLRLSAGYRSRTETGSAVLYPNSSYLFVGLKTNVYDMYQDF